MASWRAGDPEPGVEVQRVRIVAAGCHAETFWRIKPHGAYEHEAGYYWFNGDKVRTWAMLFNRGDLIVDADVISDIRRAYRDRH